MLYKIEEMIRDKSPEERYEERQKQSKPLLEAFFGWLHTLEEAVDRSSKIGEAVLYALNQETYLKRYVEDGHLSIDNLAALSDGFTYPHLLLESPARKAVLLKKCG